jgi:MFS family permease
MIGFSYNNLFQYIHELGGNDALAGLLIGCAPWAALFSAFVYSLWSNYSFKQPLLCSACFLFAGSFMYANALRFNSIPMVMIGRAVTGLGAPCGISIRFIADTISHSHRTAMSSLFVMVGAIGMSGGPGLAILLDFFQIDVNLPLFGQFLLNGMTGPGYLMSLLWFLYGIALLLYFRDGERIGISERSGESQVYACCEDYNSTANKTSISIDSEIDERTIVTAYSSMSMDVPFEFEQLGDNMKKKKKWILNEATIVCITLKFFSKFCLEILGCSVSIITRHRYDWSVKMIGLLGLVNGLLVIPISAGVGFLSLYYTDKTLLVALLGVASIGVTLLIDFTDFNVENSTDEYYNEGKLFAVGEKRYVLGIILEFCGFQASQSIVLSLLSKVVPLELAKGTFNSGFIATSAITLSRALGDTFITMMGYVSIRGLLNLLSLPALLLSGFSIMLSIFHSHKLSV